MVLHSTTNNQTHKHLLEFSMKWILCCTTEMKSSLLIFFLRILMEVDMYNQSSCSFFINAQSQIEAYWLSRSLMLVFPMCRCCELFVFMLCQDLRAAGYWSGVVSHILNNEWCCFLIEKCSEWTQINILIFRLVWLSYLGRYCDEWSFSLFDSVKWWVQRFVLWICSPLMVKGTPCLLLFFRRRSFLTLWSLLTDTFPGGAWSYLTLSF